MASNNGRNCGRCGRRVLAAAALAVAAAAGLWALHGPLLQLAGDLIVRDDPAGGPPADYLLLLQGDDTGTRAGVACRLYKAGRARRILFFEPIRRGYVRLGLQRSEAQAAAAFLTNCGVPVADVLVNYECPTDSTVDEARCAHAYFARNGVPQRVLLVTSWYHTSRAGWLFDRLLPGIQVSVAPAASEDSHADGWWRDKYSVLSVTNEYIKWLYWRIKRPQLEDRG